MALERAEIGFHKKARTGLDIQTLFRRCTWRNEITMECKHTDERRGKSLFLGRFSKPGLCWAVAGESRVLQRNTVYYYPYVLTCTCSCLTRALWGTPTKPSRVGASPEIIVLMMLAAGAHTNFPCSRVTTVPLHARRLRIFALPPNHYKRPAHNPIVLWVACELPSLAPPTLLDDSSAAAPMHAL